MKRLLVTGSLAYDYIMEFPGRLQDDLSKLQQSEQTQISFHSNRAQKHFGGCGGNVTYTLGLLNESPRLLSIAGLDTNDYLAHLNRVGVDCSFVRVESEGQTATCLIVNDDAQNRIVIFHGGLVDRAAELSVKPAVDASIVACIITPDDVEAMAKFAQECRELSLPFYFDFGSQVTWLSDQQLRSSLVQAQAAFCNEYELSVFEKKTHWTLQDMLGQVPVALVTRGAEGCYLYQQGRSPLEIPACPLNAGTLDPSGAGDAFRAGIGFARVRDWPWLQSTQLASTAAAFALEAVGIQGHHFDRGQLLERCQQTYGELPEELLARI